MDLGPSLKKLIANYLKVTLYESGFSMLHAKFEEVKSQAEEKAKKTIGKIIFISISIPFLLIFLIFLFLAFFFYIAGDNNYASAALATSLLGCGIGLVFLVISRLFR
jgi:hypothetical protein